MAFIIWTSGVNTFIFSKHRTFPKKEPIETFIATGMTEGGQTYAYNKGITIQHIYLTFEDASPEDYANVTTWLQTICIGPLNTFTYTNENSVNYTVRCMDNINPLEESGNQAYSGTIHLQVENV